MPALQEEADISLKVDHATWLTAQALSQYLRLRLDA
jgi:hypothetical protein